MFTDAIKAATSFGSVGMNSVISPTQKTIEQLHASLGVPPEAAIRPTEAQLRWAQFQSQKRAQETQRKIKKLYSFPASALDVRGVILGEDDVSSSSSSSLYTEDDDQSLSLGATRPPVQSILIKRKSGLDGNSANNKQHLHQPYHDLIFPRKKPKISKGRRALLRVSARQYQLRKEKSKQTLAIQPSSTTDTSDDMINTAPQHDDLAQASSTPNPMQSTPNRRRRAKMSGRVRNKVFSHVQHGTEAEEERVRRFEEAFHAITIGLSSSTLSGDSQTIATTTTKRWTRQSSESSTVDFNSLSRFGSIAHPHTLVGVPSIVLQRRKQRHVQGIDLEHTDSWIRYMQSQQSASDTTEIQQKHSYSKDIQSQVKVYPGEQEFAKLRDRLQHSCRTLGERVVPEAYKNTFTHRKQQNVPESLTKLNEDAENEPSIGNLAQVQTIDLATSPRYSPSFFENSNSLEVQLKALPIKSTKSENNFFHEKIQKDTSGEGQKPFACQSDQDFTQEYLKRWKQTHDKNSATYSIRFNAAQDTLTVPKGAVKDMKQLFSEVEKCQPQPRKTERQINNTASSGHKVLSLPDKERTEILQTPDMIKRWLELNGKIFNDFESVAMTQTDIGEEEYHQRVLVQPRQVPSLVLTPSLLTKRLRQCIGIIKNHEWEKASYLINANPWLVEMTDVLSGQMLLHVLALYGGTAPENLNSELVNAFPSSIHKFDDAGNLGLHLAAESGNVPMIRLLGDMFPGGASVQNVSGLLPLHLSVLSGMAEAVSEVASLFPGATAIQDNEGNLPLHLTSTLRGDAALPIVRILLQYDTPVRIQNNFLRNFSNEAEFASFDESDFDFPTSPKYVETGVVLNNDRCNPLIMAVRSMLGWEVIEALLQGSGGEQAALECSSTGENALHLAASGRFADPSVVLTILKFVQDIAAVPNGEGVLPIELVCMQNMPEEVILALVLIDLRFDIQSNRTVVRTGYGKNWWFLVCDCNDEYHDVVKKVLLKCSHYEAIALCFMEGGNSSSKWSVISRATPKCKSELQKFLRFAGRYEFEGEPKLFDSVKGLTVYDAFDFGSYDDQRKEKKKVTLRCFTKEQPYNDEIHLLREKKLDIFFLEEVAFFELDEACPASEEQYQYCIAIEKPRLTLGTLVQKASKISDWRKDASAFYRYMNKVCGVLRKVAKALLHLHSQNVVHGCLSLDTVGKFDDNWKLMSVIHLREKGTAFPCAIINRNSPPEAVRLIKDDLNSLRKHRFALHNHNPITAEPSLDIWSFGKLFFEALFAEPLFPHSHSISFSKDFKTMETISGWNEDNLEQVTSDLLHLGVTMLGVDLVKQCLQPRKAHRFQCMDQVLKHDFWKELKTVSGQRKN